MLAACEAAPTTTLRLSPNQVLRFAIDAEPVSLDPALLSSEAAIDIARNLFDGLLQADDVSGLPRPDIAVRMPDISSDRLTYTFQLKAGVSFSNGDPVTAPAFVYSWSRAIAARGAASRLFDHVADLSAPSDRTLKVKLSQPQGSFLTRLAQVGAAVVDPAVASTPGWSTQPELQAGTGPFRLARRTPGKRMEFEPVPRWWGDRKPALKLVQVDVGVAPIAAIDAYARGAYDVLGFAGSNALTGTELDLVRASRAARDLRSVARAGISWVAFNFKAGPFAGMDAPGRQLRTALAQSIDRDKLAADLCAGGLLCKAAKNGLLPPAVLGSLPDFDILGEYRPAEARVLFGRADPGGSKTASAMLVHQGVPSMNALAQAMIRQWQDNLGLRVDAVVVPGQVAGLALQHAALPYDYPDSLLAAHFQKGAPENQGAYNNPDFDQALAQADGAPDTGALAGYLAAQRLLIRDVAYLPLLYDARPLLVKPYIRGAGENAFFDHRWSAIWVLEH